MGSSSSPDRLFNRRRTAHEILGGGVAADVILWRNKNVSLGVLTVTMASWLVFERSGYTLLSLLSSVLLLLLTILFFWSKSAAILNRPAPPLPELHLTEEMVNEASTFLRVHVNKLLRVSQDIALGKNSRLFFKVALYLWLFSIIGGLSDFPSLCYKGIIAVLTVPALYERYEKPIDASLLFMYKRVRSMYLRFDMECVGRVRRWALEKKKLS